MVNKIKKLVRELAPLNRSLNNSQVNAAQISTIKSVRKLIITSKFKNNRENLLRNYKNQFLAIN
jgi:hypothetical protein